MLQTPSLTPPLVQFNILGGILTSFGGHNVLVHLHFQCVLVQTLKLKAENGDEQPHIIYDDIIETNSHLMFNLAPRDT